MIPGGNEVISHLQFADDTVLFLGNSTENIEEIKRILQCFQSLTGLKINFQKSNLFVFHEDPVLSRIWANTMECKVGVLPMKYLGIQVGISAKKRIFWKPLVVKIKSKLVMWKCKSTNMAGRLTLLKSALDSMPTYWFNLFRIPKAVCKEIDKVRRDFLWGWNHDNDPPTRKIHLLKWRKLCNQKQIGGLNVTNLDDRNSALLGKWWWRWKNDRGFLW